MSSEPEVHALLRRRRSPMRFQRDHHATDAEVLSLLESARLAPSAGNSQPWAFVVGRRGDDNFRRMLPHLARSSSAWAPEASILFLNLAHLRMNGADMPYSEFAHYDLGQAVAHMALQAVALGLQAHQFRAFDSEALQAAFAVSDDWEVTSMTAVGRPDWGAAAHGAITSQRSRRSTAELLWGAETDGRGAPS